MSEPIPIEQVQPGDKGTRRQRKHKPMKRYLPAKRPLQADGSRAVDAGEGLPDVGPAHLQQELAF